MTTDFVDIGYLQFQRFDASGKTLQWQVWGRKRFPQEGQLLGIIKWFGRWRQYTFFPQPVTVFNRECLRDIANFIDSVKSERNDG